PKADYPISGSPLIGIHLGYIGGTAAKRKLPPEKYIEAIEKIFGYYPSATVALLGTGEISGDSQDIAGRCRGGCVIDLVGKTSLPELISVIKKLSVYIGVETGPTQIAAAYKIPMVFINAVKCLKPQRWAPLHSPKVIVKLSSNCPFVCHYASCLDQRCSLSISTDEIANGVKELLDPGRRKNDEFRYSFAKSNNILFVADRLPAAADKLKALGFGVALYPPDEFNLRKFGALLDRMTLEDTTIVHSTIDRPFLFKLIELVSPSRLLTPPLVLYSREILDPAEKLIESYLERFRSKTHV
ncbi:MAG TPA: glycosyltransferase family 9 protein, partial [Candidatus Omnitrophota bacterium]|nr:glycosyltransferase family 9 protein [Candidatus Omnitrophota bacterium]